VQALAGTAGLLLAVWHSTLSQPTPDRKSAALGHRTRKPRCRKETARCSSCSFGSVFAGGQGGGTPGGHPSLPINPILCLR